VSPSVVLASVAIVLIVGVWIAPERLRSTLAIAVYLVLGALLGVAPLQIGHYGIVIGVVGLLALFVAQGDRLTRQQRIGAYLLGSGGGGVVWLLSIVLRLRYVCDTTHPQRGIFSIPCYSIETLWALIPYGALVCLGALLLFLAWRQRAESVGH